MQVDYTIIKAPPGSLLVAQIGPELVYTSFGSDGFDKLVVFVRRWFPGYQIIPTVVEAAGQIREYFEDGRKTFDLPLNLRGTEFQKRVWQALQEIPYGQVRTYAQVAGTIGRPKAFRAVGGACGANPVALVVPCHRVIGSDGRLTGFGGGLEWKKWLIELEGRRSYRT